MQPAVAGCCRLACSNKAVRGLPHKNFLISKIFDVSVELLTLISVFSISRVVKGQKLIMSRPHSKLRNVETNEIQICTLHASDWSDGHET